MFSRYFYAIVVLELIAITKIVMSDVRNGFKLPENLNVAREA